MLESLLYYIFLQDLSDLVKKEVIVLNLKMELLLDINFTSKILLVSLSK